MPDKLSDSFTVVGFSGFREGDYVSVTSPLTFRDRVRLFLRGDFRNASRNETVTYRVSAEPKREEKARE